MRKILKSGPKTRAAIPPEGEDGTRPDTGSALGLAPTAGLATLEECVDHVEQHFLYHRAGLTAFLKRRSGHLARRIPFAPLVVAAYQSAYEALRDADDMCQALGQFLETAANNPTLELQDFLEEFANEDGSKPRLEFPAYGARPTSDELLPPSGIPNSGKAASNVGLKTGPEPGMPCNRRPSFSSEPGSP